MSVQLHVKRGYEFNRETLVFGRERQWLAEVGGKLDELDVEVSVGTGDKVRTLSDSTSLLALYDRAVSDMSGTAGELGLTDAAALIGWFRDLAQTLDDVVKGTSDMAGARLDLTRGSQVSAAIGLDSAAKQYADGQTAAGTTDGLNVLGVRFSHAPVERMSLDDGARRVPDRATFDRLAAKDDRPGAPGVEEVKFVLDLQTGEVHFLNTNNHPFHFFFARDVLGYDRGHRAFNSETYFTDSRRYMAGSLIAHDDFQREGATDKGVYTLEFWPTDPVKARHVTRAMDIVGAALPFAKDKLHYHPAGETQRALFEQEKAAYEASGIKDISTDELFANQTFAALNPGVGYGYLRVVDANDTRPVTTRDIPIFTSIPNDLSRTGGVITAEPQTPLSHVNLKAKQNDTPNAYIKDPLGDPELAGLVGKLVRFEVTGDGYSIREAAQDEADTYFDSIRPTQGQVPKRDLSATAIVSLGDVGTGDLDKVGAKAANLGELANILPAGQVPEGFAIPFALYDTFMKSNGLYDEATAMMNDPAFKSDPTVREAKLKAFRKRVKKAAVPAAIHDQLTQLQADFATKFGAETPLRCRSSTNNEDLEGFNGAGLYRSYTHRGDEGHLENTIRQVWSSLWTFRAFEERDFWKIDHMQAAMGVAVHPNFDDEQANGVAVTKNIYDPQWEGYYVNAQVGEALVTNPGAGAIPEEFLISGIGPNREWETQYIRSSNLTDNGAHVLTDDQTRELLTSMRKIQAHFKSVYGQQANNAFAMDIEFKIDPSGKLVVKQARPWVD